MSLTKDRESYSLSKGLGPRSFPDASELRHGEKVSGVSGTNSHKKKKQGMLISASAPTAFERPRDNSILTVFNIGLRTSLGNGSQQSYPGTVLDKRSKLHGREHYASQVGLSSADVFERAHLTATGAELDSPRPGNGAKDRVSLPSDHIPDVRNEPRYLLPPNIISTNRSRSLATVRLYRKPSSTTIQISTQHLQITVTTM